LVDAGHVERHELTEDGETLIAYRLSKQLIERFRATAAAGAKQATLN
jgi:hypothetical protein